MVHVYTHKKKQRHESSLKYLLNPLFRELDARGTVYCVCGNYDELPDYTTHDVDIWTEDTVMFEKILFETAADNGFIPYLHNKTANGSNNIFCRYGDDGGMEFARIDILNECVWLPFIPIVTADRIKEDRQRYKNFYVAGPVTDAAMHFLYPLIHHGKVKEKYRDKIHALHGHGGFRDIVSDALGGSTAGYLLDRISERDWESVERSAASCRLSLLKRSFRNLNVRRMGYFYDFIRTNIERLFRPSGLFIAFIGHDGAGKTTLINSLNGFFTHGFLPGKFRKFYWRPYLFPDIKKLIPFYGKFAGDAGGEDDPRKIPPRNTAFSYMKFIYYFTDFVIGRVKFQSAWSRGGVVCADRYYYDHIIYPRRFRLAVPYNVMDFFKRFITKPDLTFYLYADPEVLRQRKDEFSVDEIVQQSLEYGKLLRSVPRAHRIDTSPPVSEVRDKIIRICIDYMAQRLSRP